MVKVVAIIPARSGSIRLPSKNKRILDGKPLYQIAIEQAQSCDFIDEIILTTDDEGIIEGYFDLKFPNDKLKLVIRPDYLSTCDTPVWAVIEHACLGYPTDTVILLLQPTSPLRTSEDIKNAWLLFKLQQEKFGVVSVHYECPDKFMRFNGAIFIHYLNTIINTKSFISTGMTFYIMPYERSVDIDLMSDFVECERLMNASIDK